MHWRVEASNTEAPPRPAVLKDGESLEKVGDCQLPKEGVSRDFLTALGRDGWAVAVHQDAGVLRALAYVRRRRSDIQGLTLLEAAIEAACNGEHPSEHAGTPR